MRDVHHVVLAVIPVHASDPPIHVREADCGRVPDRLAYPAASGLVAELVQLLLPAVPLPPRTEDDELEAPGFGAQRHCHREVTGLVVAATATRHHQDARQVDRALDVGVAVKISSARAHVRTYRV